MILWSSFLAVQHCYISYLHLLFLIIYSAPSLHSVQSFLHEHIFPISYNGMHIAISPHVFIFNASLASLVSVVIETLEVFHIVIPVKVESLIAFTSFPLMYFTSYLLNSCVESLLLLIGIHIPYSFFLSDGQTVIEYLIRCEFF